MPAKLTPRAATIDFLFDYLRKGVSPFHAAAHAASLLDAAGYTRLEETEAWTLQPGQGYYLLRNASSVIAWRMPAHAPVAGWRIVACHSDAPTWRVKDVDLVSYGVCRLGVEGYGGMLMATWFDRPLSMAGRMIVRTETGLESRLVYLDRDLFVIPSLAVHMDRTANDGHKFDPARELQPCYGPQDCRPLRELVAEELGVADADLVGSDLQLVTRQAPTRVGTGGELYMAPRIDDLSCAATTLQGFLQAAPDTGADCAPVWMLLDSEEIGSGTRQGALSSFTRDVLDRILDVEAGHPCGGEQVQRVLANSFCLSADNSHAIHPAHPEVADLTNPVILGSGVVFKFSASQSYTTTGLSHAVFSEICRREDIPVQAFTNLAGRRGGSTLGHLLSTTVPVPMVDIGLPQWAMHSAVETAALSDAEAMVRAIDAYFRAALRCTGDGSYLL